MIQEYEYKFLVRKNEFYYIESYLTSNNKPYSIVTQTNYYYDTEDYLLSNTGVTCRIRCIDGEKIGTLKIHGKDNTNSNIELQF